MKRQTGNAKSNRIEPNFGQAAKKAKVRKHLSLLRPNELPVKKNYYVATNACLTNLTSEDVEADTKTNVSHSRHTKLRGQL